MTLSLPGGTIALNQVIREYEVSGALIARGGHRCVYATSDPDVVVKVQHLPGNYNRAEWNVWNAVKHTDLARWLAPCIDLSADGIYLLQRRGKPLPDGVAVPVCQLPDVLRHDADLRRQWVVIDHAPCLCDYDHNQYSALIKQQKAAEYADITDK